MAPRPEGCRSFFRARAIDDDLHGRRDSRTYCVRAALAAHRAGRAADPAAARPYGCSVKYAG